MTTLLLPRLLTAEESDELLGVPGGAQRILKPDLMITASRVRATWYSQ